MNHHLSKVSGSGDVVWHRHHRGLAAQGLWGLVVLLLVASLGSVALAQEGESAEGDAAPAGGPPDGGGPPPALVRFGQAKMMDVQARRLINGQIEPSRHSTVAAEEEGRVLLAPPDVGTPVKQGQVIARIDDTLLRAQREAAVAALTEAEARITQYRAEAELAAKQRQRFETLVPTDSASESEYDQAIRDEQVAKAQIETAKALLAQRRAELKRLDERLDKTTIAAPFAGYVVSKDTEVGQWLGAGGAVARIIATDPVDVVLEVPETMVGHLQSDAKIEVHIDASGSHAAGRVYRIVPDADRRARTFPVLIRLDNADGSLKPGMTAEAELPTGQQIKAMTVPRDAVQVTPSGARVFAFRGGVGLPVPVKIRFTVGDRFVVDAELGPGEQVVTEGNERLFPGQPLQPMPESREAAGPGAPEPTGPGA